jgi:hypothetical protein
LEAILEASPAEYRNWLDYKLQHSNEAALRERLTQLIEMVAPVVTPAVGNVDDFIRSTTATRHYLTHYEPALEAQAARGEALFNLAERLDLTLQIILLNELGFSIERIQSVLTRYSSHSRRPYCVLKLGGRLHNFSYRQ